MQLQIAVSALLLTSLFAIPAQAIEEDENKKKRATTKMAQEKVTVSSTQQRVEPSSKTDEDVEFEGVPAGYYKNLDLNSF